jgi:predicted dehydrogenase
MIKLGVIGMSEGNGHPYSWSAIINGDFDNAAMDRCGFPAIPLYLQANRDTLGIDGTLVTHIWTQDRKLSEHIALAARIETVVDRADAMIGQVDAVLLARDDPEHHVAMAKPFLESGVPVFIDKPLAIRLDDLSYFKRQNEQGKWFMSCSSMRYSPECRTVKTELTSLGRIELATVVGIKDWTRYGIHMLEALYSLLEDPVAVSIRHVSQAGRDIVLITFETGLLATVHIFKDVAPTFQLSLFGRNGWRLVEIRDSYWMFRETLSEFIRSVRVDRPRLKFETTENLIRTLVGAKESLERGGETVHLR